jgi:hypothetical protein
MQCGCDSTHPHDSSQPPCYKINRSNKKLITYYNRVRDPHVPRYTKRHTPLTTTALCTTIGKAIQLDNALISVMQS